MRQHPGRGEGIGRRAGRALRRLVRRAVGRRSASDDERYRRAWNAAAREDALTAILTPPDGRSAETEASFDAKGRQDAAWLRRFVEPGAVVLDVGCGIGRIERHLAPHVARLHAVDVSDEMLAAARRRTAGATNIAFHRTSATDLSPVATASVDLAFSFFVLQHLEHDDAFRALREIARVLKADGRAVIQFPSLASPFYAREFVDRAEPPDRPAARVRPYTPDLVSRLLDLATLAVERFEPPPGGSLTEHELVVVARRRADPPVVQDFAVRPLTPEAAGTRAAWAITARARDGNGDLAGGRAVVRVGPAGPEAATALGAGALRGDALAVRLTLDDAPPGRLDPTFTLEDAVGVASAPIAFVLTLAGPAVGRPLRARLDPLDPG